jgi:nickel-dependent lactate racemase
VPEVLIPYGKESLRLALPPGVEAQLIAGQPMPPLANPLATLLTALAQPLGRPALGHLAQGKQDCVIIVSDYTRYVGYDIWLAELVHQLNRAGLPDSRIALYVASGTHRPMTAAEKQAHFGAELCARLRIHDHDADNEARLVKVGRTDFGTVVFIDERVYQSDLLLLTGAIQYHYFAGYTGGRKAVLPGVCGRSTIRANHARAYDKRRGWFAERVLPGVLLGNPVSEDMHEAAALIKPDLCINIVANAHKEPAWLGAGDVGYVHRIGAAFLDQHNKPQVKRQADIAIIGAGGEPKDGSLFQAHKSLRHSLALLKPGAAIVWAAACGEGEGPTMMARFHGLRPEEARLLLEETGVNEGSLCSWSLTQLSRDFRIHMVTELDADTVRAWGITPHKSLGQAAGAALGEAMGRESELSWAIAPDMSNLLPELAPPMPADSAESSKP